jgi:hypothetical protein
MGHSTFQYPDFKNAFDEHAVEIDISLWLKTETIASVAFTATKVADGSDASSAVLDSVKSTNTTTSILPWIKGGTAGERYRIKMNVTGSAASKKTFYLLVDVGEY